MKSTILPIDVETGEVVLGIQMTDEEGRKRRKFYFDKQNDKEIRRKDHGPLGCFYLATCRSNQFDGLAPQEVTRLIFLASYMGFDGRLMLTERTPMTVSDLQEVLHLSKSTTCRFWQAVKDRFILEQANGSLLVTSLFLRGRVKGVKERLTKFFVDGVRLVYQHTSVSQHKALGYVFQILELMSVEFNILCSNPSETDLRAVQPISIKEFCKLAGYDASQSTRLVRSLSNIKLPINNSEQHLFALVSIGNMQNDQYIVVNPRILYGGHNHEKVDVLAAFFRERTALTILE